MTIAELQEIINLNLDAAEAGSLQAQSQVIEAQAEIERLELAPIIAECVIEAGGIFEYLEGVKAEKARRAEAREREELTEFSMLTDEEMAGNW